MNIEEQGILAGLKRSGPITRALQAGIAQMPILPDQRIAFADGGNIAEADRLMAEMRAKYGISDTAPPATAQPPVQQPKAQPAQQPKPSAQTGGMLSGAVNALSGRKKQLEDALGYANGGKIKGPGTATSDSIPAKVRETGEGILVSNNERIVSADQEKALHQVAQAQGFESVDSMLEQITGKPVGPTIKSAQRAAADGMAPDTDPDTDGRRQYSANAGDAFAYRGESLAQSPGRNEQISAAIGAADQGTDAVGKPEVKTPSGEHGVSQSSGPLGIADMTREQRSKAAGIFGNAVDKETGVSSAGAEGVAGMTKRFDAYAKNDGILEMRNAREDLLGSGIRLERDGKGGMAITNNGNADNPLLAVGGAAVNTQGIAGQLQGNPNLGTASDNMRQLANIKALNDSTPQGGIGILGGGGPTADEIENAEKSKRWRQDELISKINSGQGGRASKAALGAALAATISGDAQRDVAGIHAGASQNATAVAARGQEIRAASDENRNQVSMRGQDVRAGTASDRMATDTEIAQARIEERKNTGERLTLSQRRSNFEIEAARKAVAGLTPDEIKRKTANFTATGRENPDYDPTLSKAITQSNHRLYGAADDWFDQRQQAQQPAGTDGDQTTRFKADKAMSGHSLGKQTDQGYEVHDASGRLVGHYR